MFDTLHEKRQILDAPLIVAWENLRFVKELGDVPLANVKFIELLALFVSHMAKESKRQKVFPHAMTKEIANLKADYKLWHALAHVVFDVEKAAELLKINRGMYEPSEILRSKKFRALIDEYNKKHVGLNSLNRCRQFFSRIATEIFTFVP